jgi:hypothetical protein
MEPIYIPYLDIDKPNSGQIARQSPPDNRRFIG